MQHDKNVRHRHSCCKKRSQLTGEIDLLSSFLLHPYGRLRNKSYFIKKIALEFPCEHFFYIFVAALSCIADWGSTLTTFHLIYNIESFFFCYTLLGKKVLVLLVHKCCLLRRRKFRAFLRF